MRFEDIPGKQLVKKQLVTSVDKNEIAHAHLFIGKEGSGSLALAIAFASYILCKNKNNGDSCGECSACIKTKKLVHPDIHFSFPVVKHSSKKREETTSADFIREFRASILDNYYPSFIGWVDQITTSSARPNINVKETQDIALKLGMQAFEANHKVLIMWMPEMLGKEGNRLLKLIEEPTDNTIIILVAEDSEAILPTILSRCQTTKIPSFTNDEIMEILTKREGVDPNESIVNLSNGNAAKAISLAQNTQSKFDEILLQWLRIAYKSHPKELQDFSNQVSQWNQSELRTFVEYALHFMRAFHFWYHTQQWSNDISEGEKDIVYKMKSFLTPDKVERITHILNETITHIYRNANIKILFTSISIDIGNIMKSTS